MNARAKGLIFCREVRKILEGIGHVVEGPSYGLAFFNGRMSPVHRDLFGCFDLCSYYQGTYFFHQISTQKNKATKVKLLQEKKLPGWVWARVCNGKVFYRIYDVAKDGGVTEGEIKWRV